MPRPFSMLLSVFGRKTGGSQEPWFRVLRVWSEVGDICEAESFGMSQLEYRPERTYSRNFLCRWPSKEYC